VPTGTVEREEKMRYSIGLLTAACLAAGGAASYGQAPASGVPAVSYGVSYGYTSVQTVPTPEQSPSLGQRLANLFRWQPAAPAPMVVQPRPPYQAREPALAEPLPRPAPAAAPAAPATPADPTSAAAPAAADVVPASHTEQPAEEVSKENVQRGAVAGDTCWIVGQLQYVHADGGLWMVRYAPLDKEDRYGGAVVLAKGQDMSKFREGDLVFVKGSILDEGRASEHLAAPLYRATSIELIERPSETELAPAQQ
jgi:hypothetical protein